jgi:hypothetical protein
MILLKYKYCGVIYSCFFYILAFKWMFVRLKCKLWSMFLGIERLVYTYFLWSEQKIKVVSIQEFWVSASISFSQWQTYRWKRRSHSDSPGTECFSLSRSSTRTGSSPSSSVPSFHWRGMRVKSARDRNKLCKFLNRK